MGNRGNTPRIKAEDCRVQESEHERRKKHLEIDRAGSGYPPDNPRELSEKEANDSVWPVPENWLYSGRKPRRNPLITDAAHSKCTNGV